MKKKSSKKKKEKKKNKTKTSQKKQKKIKKNTENAVKGKMKPAEKKYLVKKKGYRTLQDLTLGEGVNSSVDLIDDIDKLMDSDISDDDLGDSVSGEKKS